MTRLSRATDEVNKDQNNRITDLVRQKLGAITGKVVAILGLTYKTNTDVIEKSAAVEIARELSAAGARLNVYDPAGMDNCKKVLSNGTFYAGSVSECLAGAEFCIVATPWDEFRDLAPEYFINNMKRPLLLDCWRIFDRAEFSRKLEYLAIGLNTSEEVTAIHRPEPVPLCRVLSRKA